MAKKNKTYAEEVSLKFTHLKAGRVDVSAQTREILLTALARYETGKLAQSEQILALTER